MISLITPVYNGERFIESCLKNVIDQQCPDIEHIIMDGGSKDKTIEILKHYSEQHSHIRWFSEKDNGQSDAMNKGITVAKGNIIGVLNVDDFYAPSTLNRVTEIFKDLLEPSLIVGNCNVRNDRDEIQSINKPSNLNLKDLLLRKAPHPFNPSAYFYHKSLHSKIGFYDVNENYAMDLDFLFKAIPVANTKYFDEIWGNYRSIEGTKTNISKQTGQHLSIARAIRMKHIRKLPISQQLRIFTESGYLSTIKTAKKLMQLRGAFKLFQQS